MNCGFMSLRSTDISSGYEKDEDVVNIIGMMQHVVTTVLPTAANIDQIANCAFAWSRVRPVSPTMICEEERIHHMAVTGQLLLCIPAVQRSP